MGCLGRSWGGLGAVLGGLGAVLDRSWAVLGRSWASLGALFAALGASWGGLGASWGGLGASWGALGAAGGAKNIDFQKSQYEDAINISSEFEIVKIADIAEVEYGTRIVKKNAEGERYPVYGGGGETFRTDSFNRENKLIISRFAMSENCVRFVRNKFYLNDSGLSLANIKNTC